MASLNRRLGSLLLLALLLCLSIGCRSALATAPIKADNCPDDLSADACESLNSLTQVDPYPLYTMRYHGSYEAGAIPVARTYAGATEEGPAWGCSLFAALANGGLFGRNFDWEFSPAVLLFTDPPGAYASVTMVDIAYLVDVEDSRDLAGLPLADRLPLLQAPLLPFDGLNEHGLAVGMAAVPAGQGAPDPGKETIGSLHVIRKMLDGAKNVSEALEIFRRYNISMAGGPPIHYLIADRSGQSVLVEFYQGKLEVIPNESPWHQATNFLRSATGETAKGQCWRHDRLSQRLAEVEGELSTQEALALLQDVAQESTQWSIVYDMAGGQVNVAMNRQYDAVHQFDLVR